MRPSRFSFIPVFTLAFIGGLGCAHQAPPSAALAPTRSVPVEQPKELDPYAEMFDGFIETASHELNEARNCSNMSLSNELQNIQMRLSLVRNIVIRDKSLKNINESQLRADVDEIMMIKILLNFASCSEISIVHDTPGQ